MPKTFVYAVVAAAAGSVCACASPTDDVACNFGRFTMELRAIDGGKGENCGVATPKDSAPEACVVRALKEGRRFVSRHRLRGIDSHIELGLAGGDDGSVTMIRYDGDPGGGGGDGHPRITTVVCRGARPSTPEEREAGQGLLACSEESSPRTLCETALR